MAANPSMYEKAYFDVQKVLDEYLGTEEEDGAGGGIAGEVWLLGERMRQAELEADRLRREREFEARGRSTFRGADAAVDPLPGEDEEQHRALARGAVEQVRRATAPDAGANDLLLTDVVQEAGLAWLMTGLLPSALSDRDRDEICRSIAGRVASVLVLVGWEPPERLLSPPQCSVHTDGGAA